MRPNGRSHSPGDGSQFGTADTADRLRIEFIATKSMNFNIDNTEAQEATNSSGGSSCGVSQIQVSSIQKHFDRRPRVAGY